MSAKYKSPSFLLPNELNTSANPLNTDGNPATGTGINSLYSMDFDSTTKIPNITGLGLGTSVDTFSISLWFNKSNMNYGIVFSTYSGSGTYPSTGVAIDLNTNGTIAFYNGANRTTTSAQYSINTWYNLVVTSDGTTVKMYVNGSQVTLDSTIVVARNFTNVWINSAKYSSDNFGITGKIDEVAIFNRALNSTEIAALYDGTGSNIRPSNLMATDLNPIAYYPLGEQAQNSGKLPDTSTNEWQFPNGVLQDYVMDFNGGDNVNITDPPSPNGTQTLSMWINTSTSGDNGSLFTIVPNGATSDYWSVALWNSNIHCSTANTGSSKQSTTNVADGNWHNIIFVKSSSVCTHMYIDGNLQTLSNGSWQGSINTPQAKIGSGNYSNTEYYFTGKISNVVLWNTDQSTNKDNIYNNGSPQTTYTVAPQNWWKLNATSVYTPSAPNYTTALDFDGTDYIDCGTGLGNSLGTYTGDLTFSIWFNTDTVNPANDGIFYIGDFNSQGALQVNIYNNNIIFRANGGAGSKQFSFTDTTSWHNLTCVYLTGDRANSKIYLDGILQTTSDSGSFPSSLSLTGLKTIIGSYYNSSFNFDGKLSNYSIWNTALTSTQVSTLFNFGTPETAISFSPVSWWKLDNTTTGLLDSGSASNNGTNNGATDISSGVAVVPSWKIPSALPIATPNYTTALDFNSDNISFGNSIGNLIGDNYTGGFTISFWMNPDVTSSEDGIFNFSTNEMSLVLRSNSIRLYNDGQKATVNYTNPNNEWSNCVLSFLPSGSVFYLNGVSVAAWTYTDLDLNGLDFSIGWYATTNYAYDGKLSNFQIWNTNLLSTEASTLYNNGTPIAALSGIPQSSNLISWWKLDTGGSTITDSAGSNNGTNSTPGATQVTSDVLTTQPVNGVSTTLPSTALQQSDLQFDSPYSNYSLYFDGTTGIQCGDIPQLNSATKLSFNVWLNYENMTQRVIFSKEDSTNAIRLYNWSSGVLYFWLKNSSSGTVSYVSNFSSLVNLNEWNMLTVVYDGTQTSNNDRVKIFLNGGSSNILTNYGTIPTSTGNITDSFAIGEYSSTAGNKFLGKLDETSIFNTVLTSAEMLEIYNNGRPKDLSTFSGTAPISWWRLGENAYFQDTTLVLPNSITGAPNGQASTNNLEMISADAPGTYANGIGTNLDILDRVGDAPLSTSNSQSYNMIPSDISPYVPQYVGNQISNTYSMTFDAASNTYFNAGNPTELQITGKLSISLWFKTSTTPATSGYLISKGVSPYTSRNFGIWFSSNNTVRAAVNGVSGLVTSPASNYNDGNWHHCVFTFTPSTSTVLYIDGSAVVTNTASIPSAINNNTSNLEIGRYVSEYFTGQIDEVAIWNTALNAGQIYNDIYQPTKTGTNQTADFVNNPNLPNPVAWYRMGD